MNEPIITVFANASTTKEPHYITLPQAMERIKTGKSSAKISLLRTFKDKKTRDELKGKLPSYCFSGKFSQRNAKSLLIHSGIVAVDFDHLKNPVEFKEQIIKDKYIHFAFISPSGDGLKVGMRIPPSQDSHESSCRAITEYFKDDKLDEFTDVCRLCFESHDPDLYYNPDSDVFEFVKEEEKKAIPKVEVQDVETDYDNIYENLKVWIDKKGEYYVDGNKHSFLVKLSCACLRFGISEEITLNKLMLDFLDAASPVSPTDYQQIVMRVYRTYSASFNTAVFENVKKPEISESLEKEIIETKLPPQDIIQVKDIRDSMLDGFDKGYEKGTTTYFPSIDPHWTWRKKELTLFYGIPNHGKSQILMQLALIKSVKEGVKWGVFSPENNPPNFFYDELIRTYIGKNTVKSKNQMTKKEYEKGMDFVGKHFFYVYPKDNSPTPEYINERFYNLIEKEGIGGCIIDPFNQLTNAWAKAGRDDLYLDSFLSKELRFAQKHDVYKIIVAHPKGSMGLTDKGYYRTPHPYDLAHGAMWYNMCDNIICIHRPELPLNKTSTEVQFLSQKIRRTRLIGELGETNLFFDKLTGRYMVDGKSPFEDTKQMTIPQRENEYITPNIDEPPF